MWNPDFLDLLRALSDANAEYLVVGAYAVSLYSAPRATGDLDVWIRPARDNANRVREALARFGAPVEELSADDLESPGTVFQIGIAPRRIDVLTSIDGVEFSDAWPERTTVDIDGLAVPFIGKDALIRNKRMLGRPKDLLDIEAIESA